jgi:DNA replication protein DnaC
VPKKYLNVNHERLIIKNDSKGRSFSEKAEVWLKNPFSLILEGLPGRGKTYFLFSLIRGLLAKEPLYKIRFFRSKDLDDKILDEFKLYGSSKTILKSVSEVEFLFIDDFGIERGTEKSERDYYEIIDKRIANELVTVISTNLDKNELTNMYGSRIASRLKECVGLKFEGNDLRGSGQL